MLRRSIYFTYIIYILIFIYFVVSTFNKLNFFLMSLDLLQPIISNSVAIVQNNIVKENAVLNFVLPIILNRALNIQIC